MTNDWTTTHDLILLYIACGRGGDRELDEVEKDEIAALVGARRPKMHPNQLHEVLEQTHLTYLGRGGPELVLSAIESLASELSRQERIGVLQDLTKVASADGLVLPGEVNFIAAVARAWGLRGAQPGN